MKSLLLKKCLNCGSIIKVVNDCHCDNSCIKCCDTEMVDIKSNSIDASFEKHVPTYEIIDNKLIVTVNHVMESDHFIEWICFLTDDKEEYYYLNPNQEAKVEFNEAANGTLYAYCNKHGLWENKIEK